MLARAIRELLRRAQRSGFGGQPTPTGGRPAPPAPKKGVPTVREFAYLSLEGESFGISCKLPNTAQVALMLPVCRPAAYGLGKSGWVDAQFPDSESLPIDMLKDVLGARDVDVRDHGALYRTR